MVIGMGGGRRLPLLRPGPKVGVRASGLTPRNGDPCSLIVPPRNGEPCPLSCGEVGLLLLVLVWLIGLGCCSEGNCNGLISTWTSVVRLLWVGIGPPLGLLGPGADVVDELMTVAVVGGEFVGFAVVVVDCEPRLAERRVDI